MVCLFFQSFLRDCANITVIYSKPQTPTYAVEGQNLTLTWTYTLDGSIGAVKFATVNDDGSETVIWKSFGSGVIKPENQARFKANVTDTRTEVLILAVQRTDGKTYRFNVVPTGEWLCL